jgi:hypothetical protein
MSRRVAFLLIALVWPALAWPAPLLVVRGAVWMTGSWLSAACFAEKGNCWTMP